MCKGLLIAGTHSGCGKTTITIGILAALKKRGFNVQPFKAGPDFIDPGLHRLITGSPSRNLDIWMCGKDYVVECFYKNTKEADIAIVEGVMGLFDGGDASTAAVAKTLGLPVLLIVDAHSMGESVAALVKGFATFDQRINIAGVIFNRVAGERHLGMLSDAIKEYTNVKVLGYLPKQTEFSIPERHLGLVVAEERPITYENIQRLAGAVLKYIDVDRIVEISRQSAEEGILQTANSSPVTRHSSLNIAIAYDKAFCFYYEDNLDLLKEAGAEIIAFSPLSDTKIPDNVDAIYIGGGYPELYAHALSRNESMLKAIHTWALSGKPLYAECGGLMYLSKGIYDFDGNFYRMAQVFPFETAMKKGRVNLGYREIQLKEDCTMGKRGDRLRGHEFHYSEIIEKTEDKKIRSLEEGKRIAVKSASISQLLNFSTSYSVKDRRGQDIYNEGYRFKNTLASYVHIHFGSNPDMANNFIKLSMET
ncbi:MAG: cobyrinate a,c-diamide synthase [Nitrospirae bacterium]|nr:cobyrinate a,c-diamide synthase [Nitrospirota bacterium]